MNSNSNPPGQSGAASPGSMLDRWFQLGAHGTTVRREFMAGLATFAAMAYILAVNPAILSDAGMDVGALITATALASAIMTAAMALMTNFPLALAPGMGMNAFFAYTLCVGMKIPWQAALAMTFCSGAMFLVLTATGVRRALIDAIPRELKIAISCGIGLFILFIGLQKAGIVVDDPNTLVRAGKLSSGASLLAIGGIIVTAALLWKKVRGAIILSVGLLTVLGLFVPSGAEGGAKLTVVPSSLVGMPASLAPTFLKLDFGYVASHATQLIGPLLALLFVDLFDNMGTLIGVTNRLGLLDKEGNSPKMGRALAADASAAMVGSCLGTSTVTSYIESAAGVEEGGRTGLTALVVSGCFLVALFFHPVIRMIPSVATAPALVVVGIFMLQGVKELDWGDFRAAVPAALILVLMPLSFSISEGLAIGFTVFVILNAATGRHRELSWMTYVLGLLFALHLLTR